VAMIITARGRMQAPRAAAIEVDTDETPAVGSPHPATARAQMP
jgi:hypothetical protein